MKEGLSTQQKEADKDLNILALSWHFSPCFH